MGAKKCNILFLLILMIGSTCTVLAIDRNYDMDRLSTCNQEVIITDFSVELNGRANAAPTNPPTECTITLKSAYTDGKNRLQVQIEEIAIDDCGVFVDVMDGKGVFGNYLRRLGCNSKNLDTLYSETEYVTVQFKRPLILYLTSYNFRLRITTYEDPDVPGILLGGALLPPGAIIGIVAGLLIFIILIFIFCWCWRSGKIHEYIGWYPKEETKEENLHGNENEGLEKSDTQSLKSGVDQAVWKTITSSMNELNAVQRSDGGPRYLGRSSYRNARSRTFDDRPENTDNKLTNNIEANNFKMKPQINQDTSAKIAAAGESNVKKNEIQMRERPKSSQDTASLRSSLMEEIRKRGNAKPSVRTSALVDDVFESDDNLQNNRINKKQEVDQHQQYNIGDKDRPSRDYDRRNRPEPLLRGEYIRDSNRSTTSNREKGKANNLTEQNEETDVKAETDPSSLTLNPELVTASVHNERHPDQNVEQGGDPNHDNSQNLEFQENTESIPNPNLVNHQKTRKSPKSKKKRKSHKENRPREDALPPEAHEPLFDRPVADEPYPPGMQPFNPYSGMYPMSSYGMPYGMMPPPGSVPPGTQTYAYAYQAMPTGPGMMPQGGGQAAFFVQETPTKDGPIQKKAFVMAVPDTNGSPQRTPGHPGTPAHSSTPYGDGPNDTRNGSLSLVNQSMPHSITLPKDTGQGHRTAMMKSGVDPDTGIETNQILLTDTSRDPTDPLPGDNPQITRKTVIRTTTRSGYGALPTNVDNITDQLYLQSNPQNPPFLSPARSAIEASSEASERESLSDYLGLTNRSHNYKTTHQPVVHPAPTRNRAIKDSISIS